MKLLLDEMYTPTIAEQLRARGHDAASIHDPEYRMLEGEPDDEVWAAAIADDRALVSENVQDFRRIEANALAHAQPVARLIFTTDRQFPQGRPRNPRPARQRTRRATRRQSRPGDGAVPQTCALRITTSLGVSGPADQTDPDANVHEDPRALCCTEQGSEPRRIAQTRVAGEAGRVGEPIRR